MSVNETITVGMKKLDVDFMDASVRGLGKALMQLLADATLEVPMTPHDTGRLRGSGSVIVEGALVGVSQDPSQGLGTPGTDPSEFKKGAKSMLSGHASYNTEYAKRTHEVPLNFREEGTGNFYLSAPLKRNGRRYLRVLERELEVAK